MVKFVNVVRKQSKPTSPNVELKNNSAAAGNHSWIPVNLPPKLLGYSATLGHGENLLKNTKASRTIIKRSKNPNHFTARGWKRDKVGYHHCHSLNKERIGCLLIVVCFDHKQLRTDREREGFYFCFCFFECDGEGELLEYISGSIVLSPKFQVPTLICRGITTVGMIRCSIGKKKKNFSKDPASRMKINNNISIDQSTIYHYETSIQLINNQFFLYWESGSGGIQPCPSFNL